MIDILAQRTVSAFPLSIGTSLAFESLMDGPQPAYDPEREIPQKIQLTDYQELWINVETLFRNILGAITKEDEAHLMPGEILECLLEECELIEELVRENSHDQVKVIFYRNKREGLERAHPFAVIRKNSTPKQIQYDSANTLVCNQFFKHHREKPNVVEFKRELTAVGRKRALIMTHTVYDLLFHAKFDLLDLLESHTGVLKPRSMWYTKLKNGGNLAHIPYNSCTLQVFGDNTLFSPQKQAIRSQLIELAEKNNWHAMTTKDRMLLGFSGLRDVSLAAMLKAMLLEI